MDSNKNERFFFVRGVFANSLVDDVDPQVANVSHALHPESVTLNEASHIPILMVSEDFGGRRKVHFRKTNVKSCEM